MTQEMSFFGDAIMDDIYDLEAADRVPLRTIINHLCGLSDPEYRQAIKKILFMLGLAVDSPARKLKLEWAQQFDGDAEHYVAPAMNGAAWPFYFLESTLVASAYDEPQLYGVAYVHDEDLILNDGSESPVSLEAAKAIAERHHAEYLAKSA